MKFNITKEAFLEGIQQVQNVVSSRSTLPVLSNVLIETTGDGHIRLATTDLDMGVRSQVPAEILAPGSTTLPARKLANIIRELPFGNVLVTVDDKNLATLKCGDGVYKIRGLPASDFPPLPEITNAREFTLEQPALGLALRLTSYAASTDESRYVLNGILCSVTAEKLTFVATDGRRLATTEIPHETEPQNAVDFILPSKAVAEIQRALGTDGHVSLSVGDNQIGVRIGSLHLVSRLIDGNYPNFRQVIPAESAERVTFERETLLHALRRVALLANDKSSIVRLAFTTDSLELSAETQDLGEARESLAIIYRGKEFAVAFNPEFLMAPLRNLSDDQVFLHITDEKSPGVLKVAGPFLYVIMPMRLNK